MKVVRWLTAVAGIATLLSVQAQDRALGAVGNAEVILYRFPGVFDSGGGRYGSGNSISLHEFQWCTGNHQNCGARSIRRRGGQHYFHPQSSRDRSARHAYC